MNPLQFTISQPIHGLRDVTSKHNQMFHMQVDDTELRLLLADLYQHLNIRPRENSRGEAQQILMYMNQEQAYGLAQQKFMERQYAYQNGSVLERFRRFIGGHPLPPAIQPMPYAMQPMQMQPMHMQQPYGYGNGHMQAQQPYPNHMHMQGQQSMNMPAPAHTPMPEQGMQENERDKEMEDLKQNVEKLTAIVEQMAKAMKGSSQ